jgi:CRP-like cAMP-binding protein
MSDVVLRELSSSDIDWMSTVGQRQVIAADAELLAADHAADAMYLILEGSLVLMVPNGSEITTLTSGDVVGTSFLLNAYSLPFTVKAKEKTLVLAIPKQQILDKLAHDTGFSARFYRALTLLLYQRQREIASALPKGFVAESLFNKSIFSIFSNLNDSDICWVSNRGKLEKLNSGEFCIQQGKPLDAVYILLRGALAVSVSEQERKPLSLAFGAVAAPTSKQVAEIQPGEVLGITQLLGLEVTPYSMQAGEDAVLLAIPLPLLSSKLQQDTGFASRFYRALASLGMERIYQILMRLRYQQVGQDFLDDEGELDLNLLQQMSMARAKFNWLLQYLNVKV